MRAAAPRFAIGDVHGCLDSLAWLLTSAGLAGGGLRWTGADATLWLIGDFVDRGPDGIEVIDVVMRLQQDAHAAGGRVAAVLGNHDAMLITAALMGKVRAGTAGTFHECWRRNGGRSGDLARVQDVHLEWIRSLPAMALDDDVLFIHADSPFYNRYGRSIADVNASIAAILASHDAQAWGELLDSFSDRMAFVEDAALAQTFLDTFGGTMLVHGHTPIWLATGLPPQRITRPLVYAGGLCVNVDGGLYSGGPGFVYELPPRS